jgi:catechol 2,3-dioxygenase-like lactoylglutathione lyase family enzyme
MGQQFSKRTAGLYDSSSYRLYFEDDGGSPSTILTFFPGRVLPAVPLAVLTPIYRCRAFAHRMTRQRLTRFLNTAKSEF